MFLHTYCLLVLLTCNHQHHEVDSAKMRFHCYKKLMHFQIAKWYLILTTKQAMIFTNENVESIGWEVDL